MCEYCNKGALIGQRQVHIFADKKITVYGMIGLSEDGVNHNLRIRMPTVDHDQITLFEIKLKYCPFCGAKLFKDPIFPEITLESAQEMIKDPINAPQAKFWMRDGDKYFTIDNTECKFKMDRHFSKQECIEWLASRT